jgi:ABC-2 type transport system permease protein
MTRWSTSGGDAAELAKLGAFARRDLRIKLSYRSGFISDVLSLLVQSVLFYFVGKLVDPATIPPDGPNPYLSYVSVGIAVAAVMQIGLSRVVTAIEREQLMGTLDSLLVTPTSLSTVQVGSVGYDLVYVPIRTAAFFAIITVLYGVPVYPAGIVPALVVLLAYLPFVCGLGVTIAAAVVTFKRGQNLLGLTGTALALSSGAYFPVSVMPAWIRPVAENNPLTAAMDALRAVLVRGESWQIIVPSVVILLGCGAVTLSIGLWAFRAAMARERRRGTIGLF